MTANIVGQQQGKDIDLFVFEKFGSLNVQPERTAIKDDEFYWIENWIQISEGNIRTVPDVGASVYSAPIGLTVVYKYEYNISTTAYSAQFLSDGSAVQVRLSDGVQTTIASAGTFYSSGNLPSCAQWQSKYLLIVSTINQNGYWLWDGSHLFGAGTLGPIVNITDGGSSYTSAPTVTAYGGSGSGAVFTSKVANGVVTEITMTNPGTGYVLHDVVQLAFTGGGSDTSARGLAVLTTTSGGISQIVLSAGGHGYGTTSEPVFSGGGGSGASGYISGLTNGVITAVTILTPGTGYTTPPNVTFSNGAGASADAQIKFGQLASVTIVDGGTGYTANPQVTIGAPDQSGVGNQTATVTCTVSGGAVTGITVENPGLGYKLIPSVTFIGGNNAAAATVSLMPFGIQGNTVESYQQRAWVGNVTKASFTAASSLTDFSASGGGGSFPFSDSTLRAAATKFIATNGFLYYAGDSSVGVISNVQTTTASTAGALPTTTFSNVNVDPQIGTPWPNTMQSFSRALVFANQLGVFALFGGAVQKVSDPLDRLFLEMDLAFTPTACVATIHDIRCYCLLFKTKDHLGVSRVVMACWSGQRWFITSQSPSLLLVSTQTLNSAVTGWASDGSNLYPLFQTPGATNKIYQTKLRANPSSIYDKQALYWGGICNNKDAATAAISVGFDTDKASGVPTVAITLTPGLNISSMDIGLTGDTGSVIGRAIGYTVTSTAKDLVMVSNALVYDQKYASKV